MFVEKVLITIVCGLNSPCTRLSEVNGDLHATVTTKITKQVRNMDNLRRTYICNKIIEVIFALYYTEFTFFLIPKLKPLMLI